MVGGIGSGGGSLAKQAIQAALQRSQAASQRMAEVADTAAGPGKAEGDTFASKVTGSLNELAENAKRVDQLPHDLVTGKVSDIHEVATQLKQAELSLKFALEVRNKFIDAYREVMRMSV